MPSTTNPAVFRGFYCGLMNFVVHLEDRILVADVAPNDFGRCSPATRSQPNLHGDLFRRFVTKRPFSFVNNFLRGAFFCNLKPNAFGVELSCLNHQRDLVFMRPTLREPHRKRSATQQQHNTRDTPPTIHARFGRLLTNGLQNF